MKLTPTTRLMLESGIIVSVLAGAGWLAVVGYKVDANAANITAVQAEQKILAKDLVDTQKEMIKDLTEIKTILKGR